MVRSQSGQAAPQIYTSPRCSHVPRERCLYLELHVHRGPTACAHFSSTFLRAPRQGLLACSEELAPCGNYTWSPLNRHPRAPSQIVQSTEQPSVPLARVTKPCARESSWSSPSPASCSC